MRVRIASVQYHLKKIENFEEFENQVNFVLSSAAEYNPHYVLLPELFTTQLLSFVKKEDPVTEIKKLTEFTDKFIDLMTKNAKEYNFYIIGGSHPTMKDGDVYNTAYLFTPEGKYFTQDKVHGTRWEKDLWKMKGGHEFKVFKTKHAPISILVCYDIEFPEAARLVSEAGRPPGISPCKILLPGQSYRESDICGDDEYRRKPSGGKYESSLRTGEHYYSVRLSLFPRRHSCRGSNKPGTDNYSRP